MCDFNISKLLIIKTKHNTGSLKYTDRDGEKALTEDLGSIPSTHMATNNGL